MQQLIRHKIGKTILNYFKYAILTTMKTLKSSALALIFCLVVSALSAQTVEMRSLSPFTKISSGGSWDVILQKGQKEEIRLETDSFDLNNVITEVDNNTLKISLERGNYRNVNLTVYVTYRDLEAIKISGSGNLKSSENIAAHDLEIEMSGSGNTILKHITADNLMLTMTGSGNMKVEGGAVGNLTLKQTGSGNFNAMELQAENTTVNKSGSGNATFTANESISIRSSGSGDVQYKGNPRNTDVRTSGSGRMVKKQN